MTTENITQSEQLAELVDEITKSTLRMDRYNDIRWSDISATEFERRSAEIFSTQKIMAKQRRVVAEIRELDAAAEAGRRRDAEPRDVTVTLRNSG